MTRSTGLCVGIKVALCAAAVVTLCAVSPLLQCPAAQSGKALNFAHVRTRDIAPGLPLVLSLPGADYVASLDGGLQHWNHFPLTVAFLHDGTYTPDRQAEAMAGFDEWVGRTGARVAYRLVSDPGSADITVHFDPTAAESNTDTTFDQNILSHAAVTIGLARVTGSYSRPGTDLLRSLAAHEFGHALGINGHSADPHDLMYYSVDGRAAVSSRDLNTLRAGYRSLFAPTGA